MAMTPASGGGECSIAVVPAVLASSDGSGVQQVRESSGDKAEREPTWLNRIAFGVALLEWAGNAAGTLAMLWATVVLLGGFCSLLSRTDFWFSTVMIFTEATRVFIRNDASVNQWLFGSTRAFRWADFSFARMLVRPKNGNLIAVCIGLCITLIPMFQPEIVGGILKASLLVIISQLLIRLQKPVGQMILVSLFVVAATGGVLYGYCIRVERDKDKGYSHFFRSSTVKQWYLFLARKLGTLAPPVLIILIMSIIFRRLPTLTNPVVALLSFKLLTALGLACLPLFQLVLASYYYTYFSITVAVLLLTLSARMTDGSSDSEPHSLLIRILIWDWDQSNSSSGLLVQIVDTILPILFFWSLMFPLPGISLQVSFYILFPVLAAVLIGNLQIPMAFLQVLLSVLRLRSLLLLGHHRRHDYQPLPDGASPNLVPSILVFYMLELYQGSSYIVAIILGLISIPCRRSLVRGLGFTEEWGATAVNLYYHQAYQARMERGLFIPSEKYTPSLASFAVESLGCTSSETKTIGLRILDNFLEQWDSKSKMELIAEITFTSNKAASTLIAMLGSTVAGDQDIRVLAARIIDKLTGSGSIQISQFPGMVKTVCSLLDSNNQQASSRPNRVPADNNGGNLEHRLTIVRRTALFPMLGMSILQGLACDADNCTEIAKAAAHIVTKILGLIRYFAHEENIDDDKTTVYCSAMKLVRSLATNGGKVGARFRQELSENTFLVNSLEILLGMEGCQLELWEPVMDIIAKLALDEAARQEIGSSHVIISKLMHAFLRPDDDVNSSENNSPPLRMAAGEALANLTIKSADNCWAILLAEAEPEHNLIESLNNMLDNECYICVAANLLHNLCANSGDMLVELGNHHLESSVRKAMEVIMSKEGKQLEAALCFASQIGYVIPKYFAQVLESAGTNSAAALVGKLVDTLNSIREPCLEYPRIRRVLVEVVISIVDLCPRYINICREKRVMDALDMVKGTPSRLEKYRVFLGGQGVIAESLPMRDLVDKAKRLIQQGNSNSG